MTDWWIFALWGAAVVVGLIVIGWFIALVVSLFVCVIEFPRLMRAMRFYLNERGMESLVRRRRRQAKHEATLEELLEESDDAFTDSSSA